MSTRDPKIDAYIAKQQEFAKPILEYLREVIHAACPEVEEKIKWSCPHYDYKGQMMCATAGFKAHAGLSFYKAKLIPGLAPNLNNGGESAGQFGRITCIEDLPGKRELTRVIRAAMKLNDEGVTLSRVKSAPKAPAEVPEELAVALASNETAKEMFDAFAPSHRREYCEWVGEAKRAETRSARAEQAVEWIAEGKSRNWKYEKR